MYKIRSSRHFSVCVEWKQNSTVKIIEIKLKYFSKFNLRINLYEDLMKMIEMIIEKHRVNYLKWDEIDVFV